MGKYDWFKKNKIKITKEDKKYYENHGYLKPGNKVRAFIMGDVYTLLNLGKYKSKSKRQKPL